ncbi:alpha/beta hydrolase [Flexivirga caeni]|uniref:Alpha/beta hydrolase n=1 Tax=Flexivirga caeni TaxID=2294115 RepID=A0A3M9MAX1_9MICO|nr:alpha/beta hydrolase [Flexivirga caeni]
MGSAAWHSFSRGPVELAYAEAGAGDHTVVLLHGLAGTAQEWAATMRGLAGTHRVVALEQRGHGHSTRAPGDVTRAAYVGDVVALIERLGGAPVTLVGQSMGGHTAMLVAAENPELVSRLVMVEAGVGGAAETELEPVERWLRSWPAVFPDRDAFVEFFGGSPGAAEAWADGLQFDAGGLAPCWDADVLVAALRAVLVLPRWRAWESVSAPTYLMLGEHGAIPAEQVERMCRRPGVSSITIADAGHDVHLDRPADWLETLNGVLTGNP